MSTNTTPWWIALFVWMGASTYWHVCQIKELCDAPLSTSTAGAISSNPLYSQDGEMVNLRADFIKTVANKRLVEEAKKYLAENRDKKLLLTGHSDIEENKNIAMSKSQAEKAKMQFARKEIEVRQLVTAAYPL